MTIRTKGDEMSWTCEKCGSEVSGALPCCPECEPEFGGAGETKTDMVTVSADVLDGLREEKAKLTRELLVAAGMLSTTGEWAKKHPEDALAFIRKSAAEIAAKDKENLDDNSVLIWDGKSIDDLRQFVAPRKVDHVGRVAGIAGVESAEMLVPGNRIVKDEYGQITVEVGK